MTGSTSNHHALHPRDDRETLSALFDGELPADAMRFALKRLDHDAGWRNTCGRWQLIGDALRGEAAIAAPPEFATGVARMLAAEAQATVAASSAASQPSRSSTHVGSRRRWIGGAALAASVAMAAVLVVRPFSESPTQAPGGQAAAGMVSPPTTTQAAQLVRAIGPDSVTPGSLAAASAAPAGSASSVAVADAPRTTETRRSARVATSHPGRRAITPVAAGDAATAVATTAPATHRQPFHPPADDIVTRPWPRAVLPDNAAAGALTVDFGTNSTSPSFYPFEPRLPSQDSSSVKPPASEPQR